MTILLSIIIPFHNSFNTSRPLMETLSDLSEKDVQVIWVDDGSNSEEAELLENEAANLICKPIIIRQKNKGPGGARNTGLDIAEGEYVWFVDSDDNFSLEAIRELRKYRHRDFDFIDFRIEKKGEAGSSMGLKGGEYNVTPQFRPTLIRKFGRLNTKIFRRSWFNSNNIRYPEYCVYEDNYLIFTIPFAVSKFYSNDVIAYEHIVSHASVTRISGGGGKLPRRFFDRLATAESGFVSAVTKCVNENELMEIVSKFRNLFFLITEKKLRLAGKTEKIAKLISAYVSVLFANLSVAHALNECNATLRIFLELATDEKEKAELMSSWWLAPGITESKEYFTLVRNEEWGRPIKLPT